MSFAWRCPARPAESRSTTFGARGRSGSTQMAASNSRTIRVKAFAKLNLSLRIVGRRRDGYHELRTVFQSIALHDTLVFQAAREFRIRCNDPACPTDASNLVWRAAERVWAAAGRQGTMPGVSVRIAKQIPVQA